MFIAAHILSLGLLLASPVSQSKLDVHTCEFADAYAFSEVTCQVAFSNLGDEPIHVSNIRSTKQEGSADQSSIVVPPRGTAYVGVRVDVGNSNGLTGYPFKFSSSEKRAPEGEFKLHGFVSTALTQVKPELDLGVVELGKQPDWSVVSLESRESPHFRIVKILDKPRWLEVALSADGKGLKVRTTADAAWGLQSDFIKVAIDTPRQKVAWVQVKADVHGDIVPSSNPLDMGLMRFGNRNEQLIRLTSRTGENFVIDKMVLEGFKGTVRSQPCMPAAKGCQMIQLVVSDDQAYGAIKGKILVNFSKYRQELPITLGGIIVPKDYKVETVGGEDSTANMSSIAKSPGIMDELKNAAAQAAMETEIPPGNGPLLKWSIANGTQIYGFEVYRSDEKEGPFLLINPSLIHTIAHDNKVTKYQWRDTTAQRGKAYWYYVGYVGTNGAKRDLTSVQRIVAK